MTNSAGNSILQNRKQNQVQVVRSNISKLRTLTLQQSQVNVGSPLQQHRHGPIDEKDIINMLSNPNKNCKEISIISGNPEKRPNSTITLKLNGFDERQQWNAQLVC